jgi:hypothetical protein
VADSGIAALQRWYGEQCDGEWEHAYGIKIETLDNPGWQMTISLTGTALSGRRFDRIETHRSDTDWLVCWVAEDRFEAAAGASNLDEAVTVFLGWATSG